ncbi:MAG: FAD binding domain-containing protein [Opitutaceae bacterium]
MVRLNEEIQFILNDVHVTAQVPAGILVLDYLRKEKLLVGTKSGCKEGDCGACSVILGELGNDGVVHYRPMTSCLLPMGELQGKHLVTIEGLNMQALSPVQDAMVDCGGTQCGYCTPGFVVCMTAGLMAPQLPLDEEGMLYAISGNLCRCTGYRSIKDAGMQAINRLRDQLMNRERIGALVEAKALPEYFNRIAVRMKELRSSARTTVDPSQAGGTVVAGGTDLYVQRGVQLAEQPVSLLNNGSGIPQAVLRDGHVVVDARMTFEAFGADPIVESYLSSIHDYNLLIASWPIRTRSTLGGNLCNASPIADMTCLLLALESSVVIKDTSGESRALPLRDFYLGYKQLNKAPDEVVTEIRFPVYDACTQVNWEKVSKRAWLDIATVNAACKLSVVDGRFTKACLALGGVAATPLYLKKASEFLIDQPVSMETVTSCLAIAQSEFTPIGDVRGSDLYKRLLARQLMAAHFIKLLPDTISEEALYAAL